MKGYVNALHLKLILMGLAKSDRSTINIKQKLIPLIDNMTVTWLPTTRPPQKYFDENQKLLKVRVDEAMKEILNLTYDDGYWAGWDDGREDYAKNMDDGTDEDE